MLNQPKVHIECAGEGLGVVLLHGWGQSVEMLRAIFDHMSSHFRVLMLDLPGFAQSEEPPFAYSTNDYAIFLDEVLKAYGIENPIIIAHSFGARIALRYALYKPVHKMILTGAAGIKPHRYLDYYLKISWYKLKKKLGISVMKAGSVDYQQASKLMKQVLIKSVNEDITPYLHAIKTETLLVWGRLDEETPLWMGKQMEKKMPCATLVIFDGDDHFAYYHQMERFLRVIDCFLMKERA